MVTAKESQTYQQFSAWNRSSLDCMSLRQQSYTFGQSSSDFHGLNTARQDAQSPFLINAQFALPNGVGVANKPSVDASSVSQKRFLIFDQSGNHTRLFFSPLFSPQNEIIASKNHSFPNVLNRDDKFLIDPVEEKWDENHLSDEEGEMIEDSEEIDALLYSDSDDDNDDDDDEDEEEVTSMMHLPSFSIEEKEDKLLEEINEEVTSSKRQRLADGKYKKSSLKNIEDSPFKKRTISSNYEDDIEDKNDNSVDIGSKNDNKREAKIKIRRALNILESIVPGTNGEDPHSIIDKAIAYLKSMKAEAEDLGCT